MKSRFLLTCGLILLVMSVALAGKPLTGKDADTLKSAEWFALGGIGVAGTTSKEEIALRNLLRAPDAADQLKALLGSANLAGQCYALLGLRSLHDAAYEQNIGRYKENRASVKTVGGCMISDQPVASVAANMDAGRYDQALQGPVH